MVPRNTVAFKIHLFLTRLAAKFPSKTMKVRRQQNDIFKVLTMKNLISKKKKKTFKNEDEIHSPTRNKPTNQKNYENLLLADLPYKKYQKHFVRLKATDTTDEASKILSS